MACLHLIERCAGILSSVQAEVEIAGPIVAETLADPMRSLIDTFRSIEGLVQKYVTSSLTAPTSCPGIHVGVSLCSNRYLLDRLAERPFIKRYLKREEIQLQILEAHEKLTDDLQLFGVSLSHYVVLFSSQIVMLTVGLYFRVGTSLPCKSVFLEN